ncbi:MAG TPA: ABC transporter ATP-binding protein [Acidimicrobiia bacterium]|jgi:ABC-2 type transport system ATP-binding protein|nr:ABC transporter ATP-binding protein [Acidimicrobiia bacterium]
MTLHLGNRPPAIRAVGLTKRFGHQIAVDDVSFEVPNGVVAGFVGPNGAGKSTTLRMLLGLVRPTSGEAEVLGRSIEHPYDYLPAVGALIEGPAFYAPLSGRENLEVLATLGGVERNRVATVLDIVNLAERAGDPFKTYSLGMKQRLGIAAALLRDPALLVLDEPTNGLDPAGMRDMRELVTAIAAQGPTVFVSSHLLGEIQSVCNWLVVVQRGRLAYQGSVAELIDGAIEHLVVATERAEDLATVARIAQAAGHEATVADGRLTVAAPATFAGELARRSAAEGITLTEMTPVRGTLEDRFLQLTGELS